ncbi:MAG TPA: hypothetical protein VN911_04575 [Candidatus Acidoferrum sp.]|nr:hypothetical protein [Candidatus Acidoferrum sp.]
MDHAVQQKLEALRSDYHEVAGRPFFHFFCPTLFRDEDATLCRAHIVNVAFPSSSRNWTVQRADVDSFYGSAFESDFVDLQYRGQHLTDHAITDPLLSRKLRPKVYIGDEEVEHFIANGPVPAHFTEVNVNGPNGRVRLGLKIHPDETLGTAEWRIAIEKDVRLAALVSMLKAAHLTLFEMLGYRHALSAGGYFLGWNILGEFFLRNKGRSKTEIIANGLSHFREFANMMRPVLNPPPDLRGTAADQFVFVCRCDADTPWGIIVFVKTSHLVHSVLVPVLESEGAAARFMAFLKGEGCRIRANGCRFDGRKWCGAKDYEFLEWPTAAFEEPLLQGP